MLLQRQHFLICALAAGLCLSVVGRRGVLGAEGDYSVLIVHSYHQGYEWTDRVTEGLVTVLNSSDRRMDLTVEYLDTKRHELDALLPRLEALFAVKYEETSFDLIIVSDNHALDFLLDCRERLFGTTPIVFCGINGFDPAMLRGQSRIAGVIESHDIKGNIDLILRLHPHTRRIATVSSFTDTAGLLRRTVDAAMRDYPDLEWIELVPPDPAALVQAVGHLPPDTVILHNAYLRDNLGRAYSPKQGIQWVVEACDLPVYTPMDFMVKDGVIGGIVVSAQAQGESAALLALRILGGVEADDLGVVSKVANRAVFDYRELRRRRLLNADLPAGSILLHEPQSFYYRHRKTIWFGALFLLCQSLAVLALSFNVIRRRQMEKALREREQFNAALFEYSPVETIVVDHEGRVLRYNAAKRKAGNRLPRVGDVMYRDYASGHAVDMHAELMACMRDGRSKRFPECAYGDGILSITMSPFPGGAIITAADITQRKRVERCLAGLNECFLQFGSDYHQNICRLVKLCAEMMGADYAVYSRGEHALVWPEVRWQKEGKAEADQSQAGTLAFEVQRKGDTPVVVRKLQAGDYAETDPNVRSRALQTCFGRAVRVGGENVGALCAMYCRDVVPEQSKSWILGLLASAISEEEERRQAAEKLKESRERFRAIADYTYDCETWLGHDGELLWINPAVEKLSGYTPDMCLGMPYFPAPLVHEPDRGRVEEMLTTANRMRTSADDVRFQLHRKEGGKVWVSMSWQPIYGADGSYMGIRCSIRDISKRVRAEQDRKSMEAQVLQVQKLESLGVLAGGIAHDFNNLLMGILGNAELALEAREGAEATREYIDNIRTVSNRAAELCRQLLAYSGKGRFEAEALDLSALVRDSQQLLDVSISKKVMLRYELACPLPAVEGDATQIRQVLMNLVVNGSEAVGDGTGIVTIATGVKACHAGYLAQLYLGEQLEAGDYVFLRVADTGCGMDRATRERMFDPFFTTKFAGRGLGLAAALGIIRAHCGALDVRSSPGRGSRITVLFPASDAPLAARDEKKAPASWEGHGTILLADDEEAVRSVSATMLGHMGFQVITASDGHEAVEIFKRKKDAIALVLLDMTMPGLNGEEAFMAIKAVKQDACVVLSSGHDEHDATTRLRDKGLAGFIHKPYEMTELRDVIRSVLQQGRGS